MSECCHRGLWGQVGEPKIAKKVGGVKTGVCGVCEGVGPSVRMQRSWRLGAGGVDQACNVGRRREIRSVRCL